MRLTVVVCLVFLLATSQAAILMDTQDCNVICADPRPHDESALVHCGCHQNHGHNHTSGHQTPAPVPASFEKTTLSLCDYLCAIQQGGAACDCSISIVPGK